jgi:hypothetical protein
MVDTRDPALLASWLLEQFGELAGRATPATYIRAQVWPSWPLEPIDGTRAPGPDWVADSRIITHQMPVRSPQEFLDALAAQLKDAGPAEPST